MPCWELDILVEPPLVLGVAASYNYDLNIVKGDIQGARLLRHSASKPFKKTLQRCGIIYRTRTIVLQTPNIRHKWRTDFIYTSLQCQDCNVCRGVRNQVSGQLMSACDTFTTINPRNCYFSFNLGKCHVSVLTMERENVSVWVDSFVGFLHIPSWNCDRKYSQNSKGS
jgi:hypothetical protein